MVMGTKGIESRRVTLKVFSEILKIIGIEDGEIFRLGANHNVFYRFVGKSLLANSSGEYGDWEDCDKGTFQCIMDGTFTISKFPTVESDIRKVLKLYCRDSLRKDSLLSLEGYLTNLSDSEIKRLKNGCIDDLGCIDDISSCKEVVDLFHKYFKEEDKFQVYPIRLAINNELIKRDLRNWCKEVEYGKA